MLFEDILVGSYIRNNFHNFIDNFIAIFLLIKRTPCNSVSLFFIDFVSK